MKSEDNGRVMPEQDLKRTITIFAISTLLPIPLLTLAAFTGGIWPFVAFLYLTGFVFLLDELVSFATEGTDVDSEFPATDKLSIILAVAHFALLLLGVWAVSGGSGLSVFERLFTFLAFGLFFGQVSNSNAHELIHRARRPLHELGKWVYISMLFGHHTSAHRHVHHRYVGSERDPNTAKAGETFYHFAWKAWIGSFAEGLRAENRLRAQNSEGSATLHPYVVYVAGSVALLAISAAIGGLGGILAHIALAFYAVMQLLMSDYVQHYGLARWRDDQGQLEPVGPQHSWNAPHWFSARLMLNAPRHSDHHAHPLRPYPALSIPPDVPTLPRSLPVMGFIALFPGRWRRLMDGRVAKWQSRQVTAD